MTAQASTPLDRVTSIKVKLGLLVAVSVGVAAVLGTVSVQGGVPPWLAIPVTILLALGVTQLLATGMTSPLREMTSATRRMAQGDYDVRVAATLSDEIGDLARAFNRMATDLAEVDRERRDLVATVSHELRTPLAGLIAVLENLEDGVVPADPDGVRTALTQAERLSALVSDLLDLSRVEAGVSALADDEVPVADLLRAAVDEAATLARPVTYDVRVVPEDITVQADRARLHQRVSNLLDNASRHSPSGGVVRMSAEAEQDCWRLEVANQGLGIAPADRDRVFERFGRPGDPTGGGTGLGLAIARWVTTLHGGDIAVVDPVPGETGTRLRARLPLRPPPRPAAGPAARAAAPDPFPIQEAQMTQPPAVPAGPGVPAVPAAPVLQPMLEDLTLGRWPDRKPAGRLGLLLGSLAVGLLAGAVLPMHDLGIGTTLVLASGGTCVFVASAHRRDPFTLTCAGLALVLTGVMTLRDAEWIAVLCALVATVLCVAGSARARSFGGILLSGLLWPVSAVHGLPWLGRTFRLLGRGGHWTTVVRTVLLSVLGVTVFGLLFASADALFASWVDAVTPDLELDSAVLRVFVGVAVAGLVLATSYFAMVPPQVEPDGPRVRRPVQRRYEWLAPVLLVDAVFVLFLVAQAAATFGGHDYLRRTTGLTYAEYVHQGFGQLTFATLLTFLVVWAASRKAATETVADRAWLRAALGLLCVLTLVVVGSALHRMDLYQQAYGFTRLRLLVDAFEGWLGLLVVAVMVAGVLLRGAWLPRLALVSGAVVVLGLAISNPDAWIARHNVERYEQTGDVDGAYLRTLSSDAAPVLVKAPEEVRRCALAGNEPGKDDPVEWNYGRARARSAMAGGSYPAGDATVCEGLEGD